MVNEFECLGMAITNRFESFDRCNDKRIRFTPSEETIKFDDVEQMKNYIYGQYLLKLERIQRQELVNYVNGIKKGIYPKINYKEVNYFNSSKELLDYKLRGKKGYKNGTYLYDVTSKLTNDIWKRKLIDSKCISHETYRVLLISGCFVELSTYYPSTSSIEESLNKYLD